jgi:uncharacterized protein YjbI with pentapeptide repeats
MGLGQDVNNQKKELSEMVLPVGESFETNEVTITQGTVTDEQQQWWEQNSGKSVDKISHEPLNPAQKFYLCLAAEGFQGFHLEAAKECARQLGMISQELETAQEALKWTVNNNHQVTAVTRPSFAGADFVTDPEIKALLEKNVRRIPTCLYGADLRRTNLPNANLCRANLQGADLSHAQLYWANLRYANLQGANLQGADLTGAKFAQTRMPDGSQRHGDG